MMISVKDRVGDFCVVPDDGYTICDAIYPYIEKGEAVVVDFSGVTQLTSGFLNAAIGCLFMNLDHGAIDRLLRWQALTPADDKLVKLVLKNAKRFYSTDSQGKSTLRATTISEHD